MVTNIGKAKLVWGLYGMLAVGIFVSAVTGKPARADDFDPCTQDECDAAYNAAFDNCVARGGALDYSTFQCPDQPNGYAYSYACVIGGIDNWFGGLCD